MKTKGCYSKELDELCSFVKDKLYTAEFDLCYQKICESMMKYPHAPHPHNLLGLILEFEGDHAGAMNHFRAAYALDATYLPARYNLETYGTFLGRGSCAFNEEDVRNYERSLLN